MYVYKNHSICVQESLSEKTFDSCTEICSTIFYSAMHFHGMKMCLLHEIIVKKLNHCDEKTFQELVHAVSIRIMSCMTFENIQLIVASMWLHRCFFQFALILPKPKWKQQQKTFVTMISAANWVHFCFDFFLFFMYLSAWVSVYLCVCVDNEKKTQLKLEKMKILKF